MPTQPQRGSEGVHAGRRTWEFRDVDPATAEAELHLRAVEVERRVEKLESAKTVSQDTLKLEFRV